MSGVAESPYDVLAGEVRRRVPQPIDTLEIAAVIESMGVTDSVAREDYGADDCFELADLVFELVRATELPPGGDGLDEPHLASRPGLHDTAARGLMAIVPLVFLLGALYALATVGWTTGTILALSFGVTTAMIVTSGPSMAIGRRTSIYLGFEDDASARRFATAWSLAALAACVGLAAGVLAVTTVLGLAGARERVVFAAALVLYAALWLLSAGLVLAGAAVRVVVALLAALAVAVGLGALVGWAAGVAVGYLTAAALLAAVWHRVYKPGTSRALRLPWQLTLLEAAPYAAFGTAFSVFLLVPHVIGWFGAGDGGFLERVSAFELSLLIALPPLLLTVVATERVLGTFWVFAVDLGRSSGPVEFGRGVAAYLERGVRVITVVLGSLSLATLAVVYAVGEAGGLTGTSGLVFVAGLVAFFFVGVGQFVCIFLLGLALPVRGLAPVLAGIAVSLGLGIPLALVDYRLSAVAFVAGALTFATASIVVCRGVLEDASHRYTAAF
jgi:hypothetical protein